MRNHIRLICVLVACGLAGMVLCRWYTAVAAPPATKGVLDPDPVAAQIAKTFDRAMPRLHLTHHPIDASIATNAVNLFLTGLDFDHTFFLASDIAEFQKEAPRLAERMDEGDVSFAYRVFDRYKERVSNRVEYVNQLLAKGFDLTARETFLWKRKDAPWAADEKDWNELWRKRVKNEYLSRVVARRFADEAATNAAKQAAATNAVKQAAGTPSAETNRAAAVAGGTNHVEQAETSRTARAAAAALDALLSPEQFIRKRYAQFQTVLDDSDADFVLQRYFSAFTQAYDPHSDYMTASSTEDFDISMKLSLVGIGALLGTEDGAAKIESIIPGGPADRDGRLKAGDKILAVAQGDGVPVDILHWPLYKTVRLIRGAKGSKVALTVIPATDLSGTRTVQIVLTRDEVKLEEQAAKGREEDVATDGLTNKVGIISLPTFYVDIKNRMNNGSRGDFKSSTRDVAKLVTDMKAKGVQGILIDLRNNGGGSLAEAVEMTGLFLTSGPVVQVKESRGIQVLSDPDPDVLYTGPMVVLVNRQSASASEILAAALQDYGRAVIVGDTKTHGKGTVQSLQNLDEHNPRLGSLKVTTHSFHRIAGGSTQLRGVTPDIVISSVLDALDIGEEYLPNAMPWTVVPMAQYRPTADLSQVIPVLRKNSEARRQADARFAAQQRLLEQMTARQKSVEISLNLDDRMQLARSEKALEDLQTDMLDNGGATPPDSKKKDSKAPDLVLQEASRILADLINLTGHEKP
jgi:carboxyl-terminal processing protease